MRLVVPTPVGELRRRPRCTYTLCGPRSSSHDEGQQTKTSVNVNAMWCSRSLVMTLGEVMAKRRPTIVCAECGGFGEHAAHGVCRNCYTRLRRDRESATEAAFDRHLGALDKDDTRIIRGYNRILLDARSSRSAVPTSFGCVNFSSPTSTRYARSSRCTRSMTRVNSIANPANHSVNAPVNGLSQRRCRLRLTAARMPNYP